MKKASMFFAPGFGEVEALTVVDLLRRAGVELIMVSVNGEALVEGSHGIAVRMDKTFPEVHYETLCGFQSVFFGIRFFSLPM